MIGTPVGGGDPARPGSVTVICFPAAAFGGTTNSNLPNGVVTCILSPTFTPCGTAMSRGNRVVGAGGGAGDGRVGAGDGRGFAGRSCSARSAFGSVEL